MAASLWWRIGVPAVGLAVALAVGWRLSSSVTVLIVVCAWLPLAVFCLLAPRNLVALPIAVVLLAAIGALWWILPGRPGDRTAAGWTLLWYPCLGGLALLAASLPFRRRRVSAPVVAAALFVLGCFGGGLSYDQPGVPSADELFPLPAGLEATTAAGPDGANGCDQTGHACWTYYRITGDNGESTTALTELLHRHLREGRGWDEADCRPIHRFGRPTRIDLCITVTSDPTSTADHPAVGVELSTSKLRRAP
ncbi:hypothetical protein ACQP00_46995 [Dactylosporangium sp. CS-047395]|uniref:hypothetical protein n=1 Tax=Dactylosporangium sp. CS-047395 TaxID=3239936 RepID=UPI003D909E18